MQADHYVAPLPGDKIKKSGGSWGPRIAIGVMILVIGSFVANQFLSHSIAKNNAYVAAMNKNIESCKTEQNFGQPTRQTVLRDLKASARTLEDCHDTFAAMDVPGKYSKDHKELLSILNRYSNRIERVQHRAAKTKTDQGFNKAIKPLNKYTREFQRDIEALDSN